MIDAYFILALMSVALLLVAVVVRVKGRKQAGRRRLAAERAASDGDSDPETRFIQSSRKSPYRLLNTSEQALYHRLVEAMPNMTICCQVGIAQLVQLRGQHALDEIRDVLNRCVNFVICRDDFSIVAAVDLTWPGDEEPERQKAVEAKRLALEKLEIPLIVYRPHQLPNVDSIARKIAEAILKQNHLDAQRDFF
jgi:hypothetical protein